MSRQAAMNDLDRMDVVDGLPPESASMPSMLSTSSIMLIAGRRHGRLLSGA